MNQIIKSYLKTFIRNWVSTIGTLLFVIMLITVVVGLIATPMQLQKKFVNMGKDSTKYDYQVYSDAPSYDWEFSYEHLWQNFEPFKDYKKEDGLPEFTKNDSVFSKFLVEYGMWSSMNQHFESKMSNNQEWKNQLTGSTIISKTYQDYFASVINSWMSNARKGAFVVTQVVLKDSLVFNNSKEENWDNVVKDYKTMTYEALASTFIMDLIEVGIDITNIRELPNISMNKELLSPVVRVISKVNAVLKAHGLEMDNPLISNKIDIETILEWLKTQINKIGEKSETLQGLVVLGFQTYNPIFQTILALPGMDNINNPNIFILNKQIKKFDSTQVVAEYEDRIHLVENQLGSITPKLQMDLGVAVEDSKFNEIILEKGTLPKSNSNVPEIVLSSAYANKNNIKVGDTFRIPKIQLSNIYSQIDPLGNKYNSTQFIVSGIGTKYDDLVPASSTTSSMISGDNSSYAIGYVSKDVMSHLKRMEWSYTSGFGNSNKGTYRVKIYDRSISMEKIFSFDNEKKNSKLMFDSLANPFTDFKHTSTNRAIENINIQVIVYMVLGAAVLVLAFIFINFTIKKEMNETRRQLGIFKSMGYKVNELSWIFALKTFLQIFVGIAIGYAVSIPLQSFASGMFVNSVTFYFSEIYTGWFFLTLLFVLIPLGFMFISYFFTFLYLRETPLSLMNNRSRIKPKVKMGYISRQLMEHNIGFSYRLRRAFVKTAKGKFIIVEVLFTFSAFVYMLMFGAQALITQTVELTTKILSKDLDHFYTWRYGQNLEIDEIHNKYDFKNSDLNSIQPQYFDYSNASSLNQYLNGEESQSDSRYRVRMIFDSIDNSIKNKDTKLETLAPVESIKSYIELLTTDTNDDTHNPLSNPNYYLSALTQINIWDDKYNELVQAVKSDENITATINDLNINKDNQEAKFNSDSVFGLDSTKKDEQYNNIFVSDSSRMIAIKMAEAYAQVQVILKLTNNFKDLNKLNNYTPEEFDEAYKVLDSDKLLNEFNPNNPKYWSIATNPFMNYLMNDLPTPKLEETRADNSGIKFQSPIDISSLSSTGQTIILGSMLLDKINTIDEEPVVTFNQLFYNKNYETLVNTFQFVVPNPKAGWSQYDRQIPVVAADFANKEYGDFRKQNNFNGVSEQTFNDLTKPYKIDVFGTEVSALNTIIGYDFSRRNNLHIGDIVELETKDSPKGKLYVRVAGINESSRMDIMFNPGFVVDYQAFREVMFSDKLIEHFKDNPNTIPMNALWSNLPMLAGNVSMTNIQESVSNMKFKGESISIRIASEKSVLASAYDGLFKDMNIYNMEDEIDKQIGMYTNPNLATKDRLTSALPINISLQVVDEMIGLMTQLMIIFIALQTILLVIILIVVMTIIVDEATATILTMKSLGYKRGQINWIIMGSYITWGIVAFFAAFALSMIAWVGVVFFVQLNYQMYLLIPFSWETIIVTFLVLSIVVVAGWLTADAQVQKKPISRITNFE